MSSTETLFLLISAGAIACVSIIGFVGYRVASWLDKKYPDGQRKKG